MNQSEKETVLVKVQEIESKIRDLKAWVSGLESNEATLFDHVEEEKSESTQDPQIPEKAPRRQRAWIADGTLSASQIANRLSRELGREIPRGSVVTVGKKINAKPVYNESQHNSRYSADEAGTIMDLFRELYKI